jgi:hypothetical protein
MHGVARRIVVATGACTQTTFQKVRSMMKGFAFQSPTCHFSSFIFLQTILVCPVFESITVVTGRQLQVTVLAFSCLTTTQCSMSSAVGGGCWLRIGGGGVAATGGFFAAQPARSRQNTSQAFLMPFVFALWCPVVDGNLGYTLRRRLPEKTAKYWRL